MEVIENYGICVFQLISHNGKIYIHIYKDNKSHFIFFKEVETERITLDRYPVSNELILLIKDLSFDQLKKLRKAPCYELYSFSVKMEVYEEYLRKQLARKKGNN